MQWWNWGALQFSMWTEYKDISLTNLSGQHIVAIEVKIPSSIMFVELEFTVQVHKLGQVLWTSGRILHRRILNPLIE